jgi:hypothetical protein
MTRGARAALFFGALAAAIVIGAWPRTASAQASGTPQSTDLAAGITAYANSEVDAAMAEANAISSQVAGVELSVTSPAPTAGGQAPAPAAADGAPSSAPPSDPLTVVGTDPVVVLAASPQPAAAPQPIPGAPPVVAAVPLPPVGPVAQHDLERSAQRPKGVTRTSRSIVSHSRFLRVELRTSATATEETSSSSAHSVARSAVRSTVKSSASGGRSQRPAAPNGPLPFPPFPPNAPAPSNSGVSSTGGGGGQGALLIFFVPLAALVIFGIHRLLRRVHWSDLRMPRRGAVLPWRPG